VQAACEASYPACRTRHDPRQNALDILVRRVLQPRVRRSPGIVLAQHLRHGVGVHRLRLRQQAFGFGLVAKCLLLQSLLGEMASY
jgi:hypothetical protein